MLLKEIEDRFTTKLFLHFRSTESFYGISSRRNIEVIVLALFKLSAFSFAGSTATDGLW